MESEKVMPVEKANAKIGNRVRSDVLQMAPVTYNVDSNWKLSNAKVTSRSFDAFIPDSLKEVIKLRAFNKVNAMHAANEANVNLFKDQARTLRLYKIEWHKKIALSLAWIGPRCTSRPIGARAEDVNCEIAPATRFPVRVAAFFMMRCRHGTFT